MTLHFTPLAIVITILATAFAAFLSQRALAVFNDGVRPFLLDFYRGELSRAQMTAIAFGLSAGFIFGLGVPIAFSSGILNPWVLFLPSDILGILSPKKWLAPILGAIWGAIVIFGLSAATTAANGNTYFVPVRILPGRRHHYAVRADTGSYCFSHQPACYAHNHEMATTGISWGNGACSGDDHTRHFCCG